MPLSRASSSHASHSKLPRKAKGNISLLVIFVLLSTSLLALLALSQIRNLMAYGNTTYNYFRAHYLAKAGLELAITETFIRDAGFGANVTAEDAIVTLNFLTAENEARDPYFESEIQGRFQLLTNSVKESAKEGITCSATNKITLAQGESVVAPLFYDHAGESKKHSNYLAKKTQVSPMGNISSIAIKDRTPGELTFGVFAFSGEAMETMISMASAHGTELSTFFLGAAVKKVIELDTRSDPTIRKFLTIVNSSSSTVSFCIFSNKDALASQDTLITVRAHYGDTEVGMQAILSEPFPSFLQGLSPA